jgi:hypothetical protein
MNKNFAVVWTSRLLAVLLIGYLAGISVSRGETYVTRTNWIERTITNQIEIRMPRNVFVNEYRTNWVEQNVTNVIPVYATNQVVRTVTSKVVVDALYTNFVNAYSTNWKTLNLTNWVTFLVLKTNWITQQLTNVEEIDLVASRVASPPMAPVLAKEARAETASRLSTTTITDSLLLEAVMTTPPSVNNPAKVQLSVRWVSDADGPLEVKQWRVQRADETVLCFGQDRQFKRELPMGEYLVEVRAQRDGNSPLLLACGTLTVSSRAAVIQQIPAARKLAASAN